MKGFVAAAALSLLATAPALAQEHDIFMHLQGFQEVPAISSTGNGRFVASHDEGSIDWELRYVRLSSPVTQAHIHFGQQSVNGGIVAFLCSNLGNGPAGTQPCPAAGTVLQGTITADDIVALAAAQGIGAGEFDEVLGAIEAGHAYVNVHTVNHPGGEVRSQIPEHEEAAAASPAAHLHH